jgi:uncharacterized membrane protein HdeD (DUF308 family)
MQTLTRNWWLLALTGLLCAIASVIYLVIYDTTPNVYGDRGVEMLVDRVALAAGACTIAASIWRSAKGISWLLLANGLVHSAYGLMALFWRGPLSVRFFQLLVVVMAVTFGILALTIARTLRGRVADEWFFGLAGAGSLGFALAFLALVNNWIRLEHRLYHPSIFLWFCFYFGFSAICMFGLALRLHKLGTSQSDQWNPSTPLVNPKHARLET